MNSSMEEAGLLSNQLSFFSTATESINRMIIAVRALEFDQAAREIERAAQIDPYLTNLESWRKIVSLMLRTYAGRSISDFIAEMWRAIPGEVETGRLLAKEAELADSEIIEIARHHQVSLQGFLDRNQTVHTGFILFAAREYHLAEKALIDTLSDGYVDRADLWGAYANALWAVRRYPESQAAIVRALILDPLQIDFHRMYIPEVRSLFDRLLLKYRPNESAVLLLFFGWIEGLWKIPDQKNRTGFVK